MHNRFAVIKLWEDTVSAEDENISRLVSAARELNLECVPVDRNYRFICDKSIIADEDNFDFVIHLHFDSSKINNLFSFVALWNPIQFYHEWGYRKYSDALLTHDDYLSCSSIGADRHLRRLIHDDPYHLIPEFTLYHSLATPIFEPKKGARKKLFYCGINWDRLGKKKGRHTDLLQYFDTKGLVDIYGPAILQGVKVWEGFNGYRGEVPFDGVSMVNKIHESGIALVLSSKAHIDSELMSNRLFESLAAGANIICDQNQFARRHFGDLFHYIDTNEPLSEQCRQIERYLSDINENPEKAYTLAKEAQNLFIQKFELKQSLQRIYARLEERKNRLRGMYAMDAARCIKVCYLCGEGVGNIPYNLRGNSAGNIENFICCAENQKDTFHNILQKDNIRYLPLKENEKFGPAIANFLSIVDKNDFFAIVLPNELVLRDHFAKLAYVMNIDKYDCVYSQILIELPEKGNNHIPWYSCNVSDIKSLGNFLFSGTILSPDVVSTPIDLDTMFAHFLFLSARNSQPVKSFTCISKNPDELNLVNEKDINVIHDMYHRTSIHFNNPNIRTNKTEYIKKKLNFLKKYPLIWKFMRKIQQKIFLN